MIFLLCRKTNKQKAGIRSMKMGEKIFVSERGTGLFLREVATVDEGLAIIEQLVKEEDDPAITMSWYSLIDENCRTIW